MERPYSFSPALPLGEVDLASMVERVGGRRLMWVLQKMHSDERIKYPFKKFASLIAVGFKEHCDDYRSQYIWSYLSVTSPF